MNRKENVKKHAKKPTPWAATKASQRNARRETILRAATRCLNRLGYRGASMALIAKELGLSYNALYHYFESKEEILVQAFLRTNGLLDGCIGAAAAAPGTGLDRLQTFVAAFQRLVADEEPPSLLLFTHLPKRRRLALVKRRESFVERLRAIVKAGTEDGSIRQCEPAVVVSFVLGALEGLNYGELMANPDALSADLSAFVRHALANDPTRSQGAKGSLQAR